MLLNGPAASSTVTIPPNPNPEYDPVTKRINFDVSYPGYIFGLLVGYENLTTIKITIQTPEVIL
jgi:hypothetical protein